MWNASTCLGSDGIREDTLRLTVPIDASGRRAARRTIARADAASSRAEAARARSQAVVQALLLFSEAIAAEGRIAIARAAVKRLEEAARVLAARQEQGTVSGYERSRLEIEAELAESELIELESHTEQVRLELALRLGIDPGALELRGTLSPTAAVEGRSGTRPSIALERSSAARAREARGGAARPGSPRWRSRAVSAQRPRTTRPATDTSPALRSSCPCSRAARTRAPRPMQA